LLSDSSNGVTHVQNGVDQWRAGVPRTDVHISGLAGDGDVIVNLDAAVSHDGGAAWSTPLPCGSGGTIGLGGGPGSGGETFKGEDNYYSFTSGTVSMRQRTGSASCYPAATFRSAVMHELGHVLGLGHPDQAQSTHSTTSPDDWSTAVMHSSVPPATPSTPQTDDIQGMQYYYGTGSVDSCFQTATTLCLNNGRFKVTAAWDSVSPTQSGQGNALSLSADSGTFWFFDSANVELVVKVLNACTVNTRYWVFAAGLTDVHVVLTVTDLQTNAVKTYINPQKTKYDAVQDVSAFATCP
jgi:hypothetical protein